MEHLEHDHVSHDDNIAILQRGPPCRYDFGHDKRGQPNRRKPEQSLNLNSLGTALQELILTPLQHRVEGQDIVVESPGLTSATNRYSCVIFSLLRIN
jgi:hypothetical protein